jgi:signal transduction histidine kinase
LKSYEKHIPVLDFLYRETGISPQELTEAPENLNGMMRDTFDTLQLSKEQLYEHITTLEARNKELEAYASTVAHDLKDPLYAIHLISSLITTTPDLTPVKLKNYLQQIDSTASQMNLTINSLLLFAKVNNPETLIEQVDMDCAVANVLDRLSNTIQEHNAQINMPEFWPSAIGYTPWIEEVWANYLSNAIKYGGPSPHAELDASLQPDGMIRFWIRDHGAGLSADDQTQLFVPFSQLPHANPGHGLGLSIVLRIIEKLGGQVGCESEPGKGSLFFFTLPAQTLAFNSFRI